jgi:hypothetical protein
VINMINLPHNGVNSNNNQAVGFDNLDEFQVAPGKAQ